MRSSAPRAIVAGGSLGGLFAANLLLRAGWDVDVFERVREPLAGRGAGIVTHAELFRALSRCGVTVDESIGCRVLGRLVLAPDGTVSGALPLEQILTSWGRLYRALREAFPTDRYHRGMAVAQVEDRGRHAIVRFVDGTQQQADLLVAADGIRSTVRGQLLPLFQPAYAGYVAWRGLAHERDLAPATRELLFDRFAFCLAAREHMLGYPVAGPASSTRPGERRYNFVWYRPAGESDELVRLCTDAGGRTHPFSIPPPLLRPEIVEEARCDAERYLAPQFAEVVRAAAQPFFQPIYDLASPRMVFGRIAVIGDAAFVARPHCGAGVAKAASDATALVDALARHDGDIDAALGRFDAERTQVGNMIVERARELGNYLQSITQPGARRAGAALHHTPEAVMREVAVPLESLP